MQKSRIIIAIFLSLVITLSFCSCKIEMVDNSTTTTTAEEVNTDDHDGWDGYTEYKVTDYEIKDNAFEVSGEVNRYIYDTLDDAGDVITVLDSYFDIDFKVDEDINYENGYANWFYEEGSKEDELSASISASSKTGKFSFSIQPRSSAVEAASKLGEADEEKLLEKATEFADKFSFVTGELTFEMSTPDLDLFYPVMNEEGTESEEKQVQGRTFYFTSEYSKQRVDANDTLNCYVECGNSDIKLRDVQYFTVTILADGTIVSADNNITRAQILENGTYEMITEKDADKFVEYFTSTKENDKLVISRVYIDSYSNYFGYPEIEPVVKVEYAFASSPEDIQVTEFAMEGFFD